MHTQASSKAGLGPLRDPPSIPVQASRPDDAWAAAQKLEAVPAGAAGPSAEGHSLAVPQALSPWAPSSFG